MMRFDEICPSDAHDGTVAPGISDVEAHGGRTLRRGKF